MDHWLEWAAARRPDGVALERGGEGHTYAQLLQQARAEARRLAAAGVAPRERVPLGDEDRLQFAARLHGCLLHGAAAVPIDLRLSQAERELRAVPGIARTPGTATIMHTSGTTSAPKPVELTLENWRANALGSAVALGLDRRERWLCVMPLAHVGGLSILLRSTVYATTVVLHERFDTGAVLDDLMDPGRAITLVSLVPTMLDRLLDAGLEQPPSLRWVLLGGAAIPPGLLARAGSARVPVAPTYGMTEACSQIATFGLPLTGAELRLEAGEVTVRGPMLAPLALGDDGWLRTGDLGEWDQDGRLRIVGRSSETIVSGGENVAPAEVEGALLEHPAVLEAGVYSRPDPEWGEAVLATVVLREGQMAGAEELRRFVGERLARFKVPKEIGFARSLPRTPSGKLLRRDLRLSGGSGPAVATADRFAAGRRSQ
jgi:o-succinylbenzoate---CoA ligase